MGGRTGGWPGYQLRLGGIVAKVGDDVAVSFKDIHDLESAGVIAEEYHIALVGEAAHVRPELRPRPAQCAWKSSEFSALLPENTDKAASDDAAAAFLGDVEQHCRKIPLCRRQVDKLTHSEAGLDQLRFRCVQQGVEISVSSGAAFGDRGVQHVA